ncbi:MAG: 3'-5' exonuclease [Gammaproteobacteria bacterium]|jgi:3'-5' exonuclease
MNVMVFDIETVPDVHAGARLFGLEGLPDESVAEALFFDRRQKSGQDMLPLHLQRIVAISVVLRRADTLKVWSLGEAEAGEKELIHRFFQGVERFTPTLVSWNGGGFDLPVLHYRALHHRVSAPVYWEMGDTNTAFRYNNYVSRYHQRHTDLMDLLALYNNRAYVALDQMAGLLGYPGKLGMDGSKVWSAWCEGRIGEIRDYCETDVMNTFLVYLRFQHMRGQLSDSELDQEEQRVRTFLEQNQDRKHWCDFLTHWSKLTT